MAKVKEITAPCSDWHRSWGLGTNKIGKLRHLSGNRFEWRGHSQGRHGQIWNKGMCITFDWVDEQPTNIEYKDNFGALPDIRDVKDAVETLLKLLNKK